MNYQETIKYLYSQLPMFQRIGGAAYKAGLDTSIALASLFGNPERTYHTIHVGGTNGKGSTSHTLAAILQQSGYKVGLYTSPHLVDFRERIRVNGNKISEQYVIDFVEQFKSRNTELTPSFFELTMMMAFSYFAYMKVDYAVIEVGLGGRLDSTNIITPDLSVITNISFDHVQFLGDMLPKIAYEKAGIIKQNTPVVIGNSGEDDVRQVFIKKANSVTAPICFAQEYGEVISSSRDKNGKWLFQTEHFGIITSELQGECQNENGHTIIAAVCELIKQGCKITTEAIRDGFANVCSITGLMGRWMKIGESPTRICDTAHNVGGLSFIVDQLQRERTGILRIVIGFVNDKDVTHILEMLPKDAVYYFTQAELPRALNYLKVKEIGESARLKGEAYPTVKEAYKAAMRDSSPNDFIYIGGSTFIIADLLESIGYK